MTLSLLLEWVSATLPVWILAAGALCCLLLETLLPDQPSKQPFYLMAVSVLAAAIALWRLHPAEAFGGTVALDPFARALSALLLLIGLSVALMSEPFLEEMRIPGGDWYALVLLSLTGMVLLVLSRDLLVTFLAIELLSLPLYVLAAFRRHRRLCLEAGLKYFLFGAFASGFLVYGMALLYGAAGSFQYSALARIAQSADRSTLFDIGLVLLTVALGFKAAAAPFHSWAPDVYQGAPTPITAFMASAVKVAAFAALLRLAVVGVFPTDPKCIRGLVFLSVVSMIVGSLGALLQNNLKRLLEYSSISHAGFLLMGVAAAVAVPGADGYKPVAFYLVTYSLVSLGAFAILLLFLQQAGEGEDVRVLQGLSRRHPYFSAALALCFLSFAGIPFTAGFFGKLYLIKAAWQASLTLPVVVLVITSLISLYYYLRVMVLMYMKPQDDERPVVLLSSHSLAAVSALAAVAALLIGLFPSPLLRWL